MQVGDFVVRKRADLWTYSGGAYRVISHVGRWMDLLHAEGSGPRPWDSQLFRLAKACEVESQPIREGDTVKQKGGAGSVLTVRPGWHKSVYKDWLHATAAEYRHSLTVPASALSTRPSEVSVLFSPEMVARFDWDEDTPASTLLADIAKAKKEMAAVMGIPKHLLPETGGTSKSALQELGERLTVLSNGNGHSFAALATINGQQSEKIDALMTRTDAQAEEIANLNAAAERAMVALEAAPPYPPIMRCRITKLGRFIRIGEDERSGCKQRYANGETNDKGAEPNEVWRFACTMEPIPESRPHVASILLIFLAVCTAIITLTSI